MTEDSEVYSVLLVSVDGVADPVAAIGGRFKLPTRTAEKLISAIPVLVKKRVSEGDALRYRDALAALGAEAEIVQAELAADEIARHRGAARDSESGSAAEGPDPGVDEPSARVATGNEGPPDDSGLSPEDADLGIADFDAFLAGGAEPSSDPDDESGARSPTPASGSTQYDPTAFALPGNVSSGGHVAVTSDDARSGGGQRATMLDELMTLAGASDSQLPIVHGASFAPDAGGRPGRQPREDGTSRDEKEDGDSGSDQIGEDVPTAVGQEARSADEDVRSAPTDNEGRRRLAQIAPVKVPARSARGGGRDSEPERVQDFGTLAFDEEVGDEDGGEELELDTAKPHLSGQHRALNIPIVDHEARGGDAGSPGRSGATPAFAPGDPERRATGSAIRDIHITGGFRAEDERRRRATRRFVRFAIWMIALTILVVAGAYGFLLFQRHQASASARAFMGAPTYAEHQIQVGERTAIRACALPSGSEDYLCRYSRDWFAFHFPDLSPSMLERAPQSCFGELRESGATPLERMDCVVTLSLGATEEKVRLFVARQRECDSSPGALDEGKATTCRVSAIVARPDLGAPAPALEDEASETWEFRRTRELSTEAGDISVREFVVRRANRAVEYRYLAPELGLFVRVAELAGASIQRITYLERSGESAGAQRWPR
jgi:hypothetical protein